VLNHTTTAQRKPIGVIDAISAGYRLLGGYWYIVLVPILVDVFFWLGPQVPFRDVFQVWVNALPPDARESVFRIMGISSASLEGVPNSPNVLTLLVEIPGAPASLAAALGGLPAPPGWTRPHYVPSSLVGLIGFMVGLMLLGTPLAGLYMSLAAKAVPAVRERTPSLARLWVWVSVNLLVLVLVGLFLLAGGTLLLGAGAALLAVLIPPAVPAILAFIAFVTAWISLMVMFFLYFTPASIAAHGVSVVRAVGESMVVVLRNMGSTLGLILVIMLINQGFALIWARLFAGFVGGAVSILGNAFLTSGLTVATVIFFHDRYLAWEEKRQHVYEQLAGK